MTRWTEPTEAIIALMIRLLCEDKKRHVLTIDAGLAQFSDIPQFHLAGLLEPLPKS